MQIVANSMKNTQTRVPQRRGRKKEEERNREAEKEKEGENRATRDDKATLAQIEEARIGDCG